MLMEINLCFFPFSTETSKCSGSCNNTNYPYAKICVTDIDIDNSYEKIDIYFIGYITIKKIHDCQSIYTVNLLYLRINHASGYIEERNGNKYLIFDSLDENKEVLKKYGDVWDGIKNKIKAINGDKENDYEKDYMKIKFNSDDDLPLNKLPKFHLMTIIIRSVFNEYGKFYPQLFLDDTLYELV